MIFTLKLVICNVAFAVSLPSLQLILISPIHEILKEAEPLELKEPLIVLSSYEIINACIIVVFNLVPMSFYRLFYKISHSLLLNIIYSEILLLILNKLPKKYKKININ